jgi:CMP-N,N'-diacetyllegionaminic acid synthase
MKILAVIPARGGSKRLPGKNIRMLGGKPLIVWSIEASMGIPDISDVLVSTDDTAIASISREAGGLVPWLRPVQLATDLASSVDVVIHALDWYENKNGVVDGVLLLQPTSPFRTKESICKGIELFRSNHRHSVIGVSPAPSHPMWTLKTVNGYLAPFLPEHGLDIRSQDLPQAYIVNGSFYLSSPENLRMHRTFTAMESVPLVTARPEESLDIDTPWDFRIAEFIVSEL